MKTFWLSLRPSKTKIVFSIVLTLASILVTSGFQATSKVTWYANRGFPLPFMTLSEAVDRRICQNNTICIATNISNIFPIAIVLDILGWYVVSCLIVFAYQIVKEQFSGDDLLR